MSPNPPPWHRQDQFLYLLISLLAFFVISSLLKNEQLKFLISTVFVFVLASSLYALRKGHLLTFIIVLMLGISYISLDFYDRLAVSPPHYINLLRILCGLLYLGTITITTICDTLRRAFIQNDQIQQAQNGPHPPWITRNTIFGAICGYLLLGLSWGYIYLLILYHHPGAFHPSEPVLSQVSYEPIIYYSYVTLTTLGYGDIVAISVPAKTFSWLEAIAGQMYLTILIAALIGGFISQRTQPTHRKDPRS